MEMSWLGNGDKINRPIENLIQKILMSYCSARCLYFLDHCYDSMIF